MNKIKTDNVNINKKDNEEINVIPKEYTNYDKEKLSVSLKLFNFIFGLLLLIGLTVILCWFMTIIWNDVMVSVLGLNIIKYTQMIELTMMVIMALFIFKVMTR